MTVTQSPEYRTLQRDSSNDILRHDARRGDGELALAVVHARKAGSARLRMGDLAKAAGDYARAATDWLSAGACFYLAADLTGLEEAVQKVEALRDADKIPSERTDLKTALSERVTQQNELRSKLEEIRRDSPRLTGAATVSTRRYIKNLIDRTHVLTASIEDIGADSLDIVELVMELEAEFDVQIPNDQAEKIKTVGEAIDYIEKAIKNKPQS